MKKIIKIFFIFAIMFTPKIVNARELCEYDQKVRIQKIATNITTSYDYYEKIAENKNDYNSVKFNVKISNMHNDVSIVYEKTGEKYYNNPSGEILLENIEPGTYLKLYVMGNIAGCYEERLLTVYVTLPSFNKFYTEAVCNKVPNYKLCNKWANVNLTTKEFKKNIDDYIESMKKNESVEIPRVRITTFEKIIAFLADYSIIIFGSIIIVCAGLIYYLTKKDDFDLSIK